LLYAQHTVTGFGLHEHGTWLEVRVPLIDHQLARRVLALPGRWKLDARTPKPLLVHALAWRTAGQHRSSPKRGFTLPFEHWLRDAMRPKVEESLRKIGDGVLGSLISEPAARGVWQDFSRPNFMVASWSLYVLQRWCEQHLSS